MVDLWTVALINDNDVSTIFTGMVNNNCYTRDSERDITELASNLEQILTFGIIESIIDFFALIFDGCSCALGGLEDKFGMVAFVIHGVSVFFDIIISSINFFAYVIPAFDAYNKQNDLSSRCYTFTYGYQDTTDTIDTSFTTTFNYSSINETMMPPFHNNGNNDEFTWWPAIVMLAFFCVFGCLCLCWCGLASANSDTFSGHGHEEEKTCFSSFGLTLIWLVCISGVGLPLVMIFDLWLFWLFLGLLVWCCLLIIVQLFVFGKICLHVKFPEKIF